MQFLTCVLFAAACFSSLAFAIQSSNNNTLCSLEKPQVDVLPQCLPSLSKGTVSEKFAQDFDVLQPTPGAIVKQTESPEPQATPELVEILQSATDAKTPALPANQPLPTEA